MSSYLTKAERGARKSKKRRRTMMRQTLAAMGEQEFSKSKQMPERVIPADGMDRFKDLITGKDREICLTPEAMEARRMELYARAGGHCEGCRIFIEYEGIRGFHLHHVYGKGAGKRCDCMKCIQALCKDKRMEDGSMRPGCHSKVHHVGILDGPYERPETEAQ